MVMFVLPVTEAVILVVKLPVYVPLAKVPVVKSMPVANAAVGKHMAKSANSITRFIPAPPFTCKTNYRAKVPMVRTFFACGCQPSA